jgi:hypothetical protein
LREILWVVVSKIGITLRVGKIFFVEFLNLDFWFFGFFGRKKFFEFFILELENNLIMKYRNVFQ